MVKTERDRIMTTRKRPRLVAVFLFGDSILRLSRAFGSHSGVLLQLVVVNEDALKGSQIPSETYSEHGWNVMLQKKDGLIVM
jgi:hypothetical protein